MRLQNFVGAWLGVALTLLSSAFIGCRPEGFVAKAPAREVAVALPPPVEYSTTPTPDGVRGGARAEKLCELVREHFPELTLAPDGRLADLAAKVLFKTQDEGSPMPDSLHLSALAQQHGHIGSGLTVIVVPFMLGEWRRVDELLGGVMSNLRFTHIGVVSRDVGGGAIGVFVLSAQHLSLSPVPSNVTEGATLRFSGEIDAEYRDLGWMWTLPDGSTRTIAVAKTRGFSFVTEPLVPGVHRFEAFGVGPWGLEVLANLPITVGSVGIEAEPDETPDDGQDPEGALLGMVNRARARAGARPLLRAAALDRVAEAHSRDMVENNFFGHDSKATGSSPQRVADSGLRLEVVGENVARGSTVAVIHRSLMESPGHRLNVLRPEYTHVGIGVVQNPSVGPALAVTQLFSVFPGPLADPRGFSASLFRRINVFRADAAVPEVVNDPVLESVAAAVAARLSASKDVNRRDVTRLVTEEEIAAVGHGFFLIAMFPARIEDFSSSPVFVDAHIHAIGLGVVQSEATEDHPRTNVVVFAMSE